MAQDLGTRLLRAGIITREQLAEAVAAGARSGGALAAALVARGVPEDALVGFFLADGHGPLLHARDLEQAEPTALKLLSADMARALQALPIRASATGIVLAMADPSDRHAAREIEYATKQKVLPTVVRVTELARAITRSYKPFSSDRTEVLTDADLRSQAHKPFSADRTQVLSDADLFADADEPEAPVELVRRRGAPPAVIESKARLIEQTASSAGPYDRVPDDDAATRMMKLGPRLAEYEDDDSGAMPLVRTKPFATPDTAQRPLAVAPAAPTAPGKAPSARAPIPRPSDRATARASSGRSARPLPPPPRPPPTPVGSAVPTRGTRASVHPPPEDREGSTKEYALSELTGPTERISVRPKTGRPAPPDDRWGELSEPPRAAKTDAKLTPAQRQRLTSSPPREPVEIGTVLAAIRGSKNRDDVVRLAVEGASAVGRTAVFLVQRKGVLKGWDAHGGIVSKDAVRNLWIPSTSPSVLRDVVARIEPYRGPQGGTAADILFRAAIGSRGGRLVAQPVVLGGKAIGILCVDDPRSEELAVERLEVLAKAVADAFERIIVTGKST